MGASFEGWVMTYIPFHTRVHGLRDAGCYRTVFTVYIKKVYIELIVD